MTKFGIDQIYSSFVAFSTFPFVTFLLPTSLVTPAAPLILALFFFFLDSWFESCYTFFRLNESSMLSAL